MFRNYLFFLIKNQSLPLKMMSPIRKYSDDNGVILGRNKHSVDSLPNDAWSRTWWLLIQCEFSSLLYTQCKSMCIWDMMRSQAVHGGVRWRISFYCANTVLRYVRKSLHKIERLAWWIVTQHDLDYNCWLSKLYVDKIM